MTQPPKAAIYTRTGDQGTTKLVDGTEVAKHSIRVDAYGTVDELNSQIGLARSWIQDCDPLQIWDKQLEAIQCDLFNLGSLLACESIEMLQYLPQVKSEHILKIEHWIDELTQELPPLKNFILPTGHPIASQFHIIRTVCRRAERKVSEISAERSLNEFEKAGLIYLNRLSDLFFTLARSTNLKTKTPEVLWSKT